MKTLAVFLAGLFFSFSCAAQDSLPVKKDTLFRNELGMNFAPWVTILLAARPLLEFRHTFSYKHAFADPRFAFRSSLVIRQLMEDPGTTSVFFPVSDTSRIRNELWTKNPTPFQVGIGLEKRTYIRSRNPGRWLVFLSLDAIGGLYRQRYRLSDVKERLNDKGEWETNRYATPPYVFPVIVYEDRQAFSWYAGVNSGAGLRWLPLKHLVVTVQFGVDAVWLNETTYDRGGMGYALEKRTEREFRLGMPSGPVNELLVAYRF